MAAASCSRESASARVDTARVDTARGAVAGDAPATIAIVSAADWIGSEWSEDAIYAGLQEEGFQKGRDFVFRSTSAQGDLATLPSLIDAAIDGKAKIIVALQDPTLKAALQRVKDNTPIVFHVLADPFAAGAGTSDSNHLPNVTGVYSPGFGDPEQEKRIDLIRRIVPTARRIGVLFSPDEPYAVEMKDKLTQAGRRAKLEVVAVPVTGVSEGGTAAQAIIGRKVDAIEIFGNTAHAAFPSIVKVAQENKVPVFSPSPFEMLRGATAAVYPDFQEGGIVAGRMIGRVMKGESPAGIPFYRVVTTKTSVADSARRQ
jgi:ABC-type uncharacterized transport system substrate-binding protein